jgi:hypothetical protein
VVGKYDILFLKFQTLLKVSCTSRMRLARKLKAEWWVYLLSSHYALTSVNVC